MKHSTQNLYPNFDSIFLADITAILAKKNFRYQKSLLRGALFSSTVNNSALMVDYQICNPIFPFTYCEYTKEQNEIMHQFCPVFRLLADCTEEFAQSLLLLEKYLDASFDENEIKSSANRELQEVDPTLPEAYFEQAFIDAFGREALNKVTREYPVIDANGQTRWIDYFIHSTKNGQIAVEKNGEKYHHPQIIGKKRHENQLLKQNSLAAYGMRIFRWSLHSMQFKDNFEDELKRFLGPAEHFTLAQKVSITRNFSLLSHQKDALIAINNDRADGKNAFLVVLPTGTGKTEILIADLASEYKKKNADKCLIMVPSSQLRIDLVSKIKNRLIDHSLPHLLAGTSFDSNIVVQTYATMSRCFHQFPSDYFHYIVVDEAHHATAPTVRKVIHHFNPKTLLGLTATDKRLDAAKLEDIFGAYDT
ncbi:MAG: DEAD/DEAH box helicase family protein, partial [Lentisphaeria bacterium]